VGQLRSFIESEVQSLRSQFEKESAKVEQNFTALCKCEATNTGLSQQVAEVRRDFAKLQEMGITCDSGVNELRSRLEVVVRECDEHISKEQSRKAEGSAAFMNSLKLKQVLARSEDNGLSDRVQSLEHACQQAIAMPSVVLEATESLQTELRQVVDPLREDVECLKRAMGASSHRNGKEFGDVTESKDRERLIGAWLVAAATKQHDLMRQ